MAAQAGAHIKPAVMELGGSDAFIVMPSADLEKATTVAVNARISNNGQSCIAGKRFVVHQDIYDAFLEKFVAKMSALQVGDPLDPATNVGPLATERGLPRPWPNTRCLLSRPGATPPTRHLLLDSPAFFSFTWR